VIKIKKKTKTILISIAFAVFIILGVFIYSVLMQESIEGYDRDPSKPEIVIASWGQVDNSAYMDSKDNPHYWDELEKMEVKVDSWKELGYSDCNIENKDYEGTMTKPGMFYVFGSCRECPKDMVKIKGKYWISDSGQPQATQGTCVEKQCEIGDVKTITCGDNSEIISHVCDNYLWNATNNVCCDIEGEVQYCENGAIEFRCENQDWIKINECFDEETTEEVEEKELEEMKEIPTEEEKSYLIYWILGIIGTIVLVGTTIYFITKKR